MKKLVIIKTGDTFSGIAENLGDFEDWISLGLGIDKKDIRVVDTPRGEVLPSAWGIQFHPEYDTRIMKAYVRNMETTIKQSDLILSEILDKIEPTPLALKILKRFGKLAG